MIHLYCHKKHGNKDICTACQKVLEYACNRLDNCKFAKQKPSCKICPIHCYKPEMREVIKKVMRFSGPRMFLYHPLIFIKHISILHKVQTNYLHE